MGGHRWSLLDAAEARSAVAIPAWSEAEQRRLAPAGACLAAPCPRDATAFQPAVRGPEEGRSPGGPAVLRVAFRPTSAAAPSSECFLPRKRAPDVLLAPGERP